MARNDLGFCIMTFHISSLMFYLIIYLHNSGARDWERNSGRPWIREKEEHKTSFHIESHLYILGPSPVYGSLQYVTKSRGEYNLHPCHHHHGHCLSYLCCWVVPHHQIIMEQASQLSKKSEGIKI